MPTFDYKGARDAGYSDQAITTLLQQKKQQGIDISIDRSAYDAYNKPKTAQPKNFLESWNEKIDNIPYLGSINKAIGSFTQNRAQSLIKTFDQMKTDKGISLLSQQQRRGQKLTQDQEAQVTDYNQRKQQQASELALGFMGESGAITKAEKIAGKTIPQYLMDKAIGTSKKVLEAGRSPAQQALNEGIMGTGRQIESQYKEIISEVEPKIDELLKNSNARSSIKDIYETIAKKFQAGGSDITAEGVQNIVQGAAPKVNNLASKAELAIADTNKLRKGVDRMLNDRYFLNSTHPFNKEVAGEFANTLRNEVQTKVPETKALFERFSGAIGVGKAITKKLNNAYLIPFLTISAPTAIGTLMGDTKHGLEVGTALELLREGRKSPLVLSTLAQTIEKLSNNPQASRGLARMLKLIGDRLLTTSNDGQDPASGSNQTNTVQQ